MKPSTRAIIDDGVKRYPALAPCRQAMEQAVDMLIESFKNGGKLLTCGNGGSAADAMHIVGELMKSFVLERPVPEHEARQMREAGADGAYMSQHLQGALPAMSLVGETALETAYANDVAPQLTFAQQVYGLGRKGDVLLGISTSGNSRNILYAAQTASFKGMKVIAMTGEGGGKIGESADCTIAVPSRTTYQIQELHLPIYHSICLALESEFFGNDAE